jgi:hypothetical protein
MVEEELTDKPGERLSDTLDDAVAFELLVTLGDDEEVKDRIELKETLLDADIETLLKRTETKSSACLRRYQNYWRIWSTELREFRTRLMKRKRLQSAWLSLT